MLGSLLQLKQLGFKPETVIDVGAALGTAPLYTAFPESRHFLIEPLVENEQYLAKLCKKLGNADYIIAAAAKESGYVDLRVSRTLVWSSMVDSSESNSENSELPNLWLNQGEVLRATEESKSRRIPAITLDELCQKQKLSGPYLIKVDVDGAEVDVLAGAVGILQETEYVIVEATLFGQIYDVINFMKLQGFAAYDIVDTQYRPLDGALSQVDIAFVKNFGRFRKSDLYCGTKEQEEALIQHLKVYREFLIEEIEKVEEHEILKEYVLTELDFLQQRANAYLNQGDYRQAANIYEQAIKAEPDTKSHYWNLGLMLLLDGQEAEAQTTWLLGMTEGDMDQVELWTAELMQVLEIEAYRRGSLAEYSVAWAIRQHMREINPGDINNLLHLMGLSILQETYIGEEPTSLGVIELFQSEQAIEVDFDLLMQVLKSVLECAPLHPSSLEFAEACIPHVSHPKIFIQIVVLASLDIAYVVSAPRVAIRFAELCLRLNIDEEKLDNVYKLTVLQHLSSFYQDTQQYDEGIKLAKECYLLAEGLPDKVFSNHKIIRGLMSAVGYWEEVCSLIQEHELLLDSLIAKQSKLIDQPRVQNLFSTTFFFPYIEDRAKRNREIQNQLTQLCQDNIQVYAKEQVERFQQGHLDRRRMGSTAKKPLKIGYISHCMRRHSVGWLARWLFKYHDRERFQLYGYFMLFREARDMIQEWYVDQFDQTYKGGLSGIEMADKIYQDEIDILIDLDSITLDVGCEVMGLKPAPIQATWLGWDASGLPAVDYFIADPYVLPESASDYYSEKIWRLPQTYIAVDGFEVDVPNLRRDQLDIPSDAVIYLSAQKGYKRHPDTVRMQMQILKEVPNSYFLIKGSGKEESKKTFFFQIAEEKGIERDRLRFLPEAPLEQIHRANLGIADVVLDTYPYNGATTTLETLWMGIPIVTRVGQQFAARNSYTMMMNVGVTEGIAWTDEEYVEWGIRLGKDPVLRQEISRKLRQSRQTSPLWNAEKFTREMENAYEQMWQKYIEGDGK